MHQNRGKGCDSARQVMHIVDIPGKTKKTCSGFLHNKNQCAYRFR